MISRCKLLEYIKYDFGDQKHRANREKQEIKLSGVGRGWGVQVFSVFCTEWWGIQRGYETQDYVWMDEVEWNIGYFVW